MAARAPSAGIYTHIRTMEFGYRGVRERGKCSGRVPLLSLLRRERERERGEKGCLQAYGSLSHSVPPEPGL